MSKKRGRGPVNCELREDCGSAEQAAIRNQMKTTSVIMHVNEINKEITSYEYIFIMD